MPRAATKPAPKVAATRMTRASALSQKIDIPSTFKTPPDIRRRAGRKGSAPTEQREVDEIEDGNEDEDDGQIDTGKDRGDQEEAQEHEGEQGQEVEGNGDEEQSVRNQSSQREFYTKSLLLGPLGTPEAESIIVQFNSVSGVVRRLSTPSIHMSADESLAETYIQAASSPQQSPTIEPSELRIPRKRLRSESAERQASPAGISIHDLDEDELEGQAFIIERKPRDSTINRSFGQQKRIRTNLGRVQPHYDISVKKVLTDLNQARRISAMPTESAAGDEAEENLNSAHPDVSIPSLSKLMHLSPSHRDVQSAPSSPSRGTVLGFFATPLKALSTRLFGASHSAAPVDQRKDISPARSATESNDHENSSLQATENTNLSSVNDNLNSEPNRHIASSKPENDSMSTPSRRRPAPRRPQNNRGSARNRQNLRMRPTANQPDNPTQQIAVSTESAKARKLGHDSFSENSASSSRRRQHETDFRTESVPTQDGKRKLAVGRTFTLPESDSSSDESLEEPTQVPPLNGATKSLQSSTGVTGKTFTMPDSSLSEDNIMANSTQIANIDHRWQVGWTEADLLKFLRTEGVDFEELVNQAPRLLRQELPDSWTAAFVAFRRIYESQARHMASDMEEVKNQIIRSAKASAEYWEKTAQENERKAQLMNKECEDLEKELYQLRSLAGAQREAQKLAQDVQNQSPVSSFNIFEAAHANDTSTQSQPHSPKNITWTENKENHVTSPGPNEPPTYTAGTTSAAKSALKPSVPKTTTRSNSIFGDFVTPKEAKGLSGRELESYESQLNASQKFTPKQPSRLREVSLPQGGQLLAPGSSNEASSNSQDVFVHSVIDAEPATGQTPTSASRPDSTTTNVSNSRDDGMESGSSTIEPVDVRSAALEYFKPSHDTVSDVWLNDYADIDFESNIREALLVAMSKQVNSPFVAPGFFEDDFRGVSLHTPPAAISA